MNPMWNLTFWQRFCDECSALKKIFEIEEDSLSEWNNVFVAIVKGRLTTKQKERATAYPDILQCIEEEKKRPASLNELDAQLKTILPQVEQKLADFFATSSSKSEVLEECQQLIYMRLLQKRTVIINRLQKSEECTDILDAVIDHISRRYHGSNALFLDWDELQRAGNAFEGLGNFNTKKGKQKQARNINEEEIDVRLGEVDTKTGQKGYPEGMSKLLKRMMNKGEREDQPLEAADLHAKARAAILRLLNKRGIHGVQEDEDVYHSPRNDLFIKLHLRSCKNAGDWIINRRCKQSWSCFLLNEKFAHDVRQVMRPEGEPINPRIHPIEKLRRHVKKRLKEQRDIFRALALRLGIDPVSLKDSEPVSVERLPAELNCAPDEVSRQQEEAISKLPKTYRDIALKLPEQIDLKSIQAESKNIYYDPKLHDHRQEGGKWGVLDQVILRDLFQQAVRTLGPKLDRQVMEMVHNISLEQSQEAIDWKTIASQLGVTQEEANNLYDSAKMKVVNWILYHIQGEHDHAIE